MSLLVVSILIAATNTQESLNNERRASRKYQSSNNATEERQGKLLPLWSVYRFANNICQGVGNQSGICVSPKECPREIGIVVGQCATGRGVCCVIEMTCGGTAKRNITYFINRNYPEVSTGDQLCVLQVSKITSNVVQLRLDLEEFRMTGPFTGTCNSDVMTITGQDSDNRIPPICGINSGQHVYVNVGTTQGPILISITSTGTNSSLFRILITQLERGNPILAPNECLQYFLGATGLLKSFNFDSPTPGNGQSNYLNDMNYALCLRREAGTCAVIYTATEDVDSFDVGIPAGMSGLDGSCNDDYVFIPGARNVQTTQLATGSRFCGAAFSASPASSVSNPLIYDSAGPIQLTFITNDNTDSSSADRGFSIRFQQIPCATFGK